MKDSCGITPFTGYFGFNEYCDGGEANRTYYGPTTQTWQIKLLSSWRKGPLHFTQYFTVFDSILQYSIYVVQHFFLYNILYL